LWPLMPTVAIGFLGVVAAIMTVRADRFTPVERAMYVLLAFALFIVEMNAVYKDRDEHDKQQAELQMREREARQKEEASFAALLTEGRDLLGKTQEVETLTKKNLDNITGGESYALVTPQVWSGLVPIPLSIRNYGKQTLTGVTVVIRGRQNWDLDNPRSMYDLPTVNVGTLHAGELRLLKVAITPVEGEMKDGDDRVDVYDLDISAQNFTANEHLLFKRGKHVPWDFMYQVTRQFVTSQTKTKTTFGYKTLATTKWMGN
jgi:cell division protein FtsL